MRFSGEQPADKLAFPSDQQAEVFRQLLPVMDWARHIGGCGIGQKALDRVFVSTPQLQGIERKSARACQTPGDAAPRTRLAGHFSGTPYYHNALFPRRRPAGAAQKRFEGEAPWQTLVIARMLGRTSLSPCSRLPSLKKLPSEPLPPKGRRKRDRMELSLLLSALHRPQREPNGISGAYDTDGDYVVRNRIEQMFVSVECKCGEKSCI